MVLKLLRHLKASSSGNILAPSDFCLYPSPTQGPHYIIFSSTPSLMLAWSPGWEPVASLLSVLELPDIKCGFTVSTLYPEQPGRGIAANNRANGGNGRRETDVSSSQEGWWHALALLSPRALQQAVSSLKGTAVGQAACTDSISSPERSASCSSQVWESPSQEGNAKRTEGIVLSGPLCMTPDPATAAAPSGSVLGMQIPRSCPSSTKP